MKIVLINPNHLWYTEKDAYLSKGQINLRKVLPPQGIAYLASIIRHEHDVRIIEANPKAVEDYRKGKEVSLQFLVGKAMGELKGRGNPELLKKLFLEYLAK